MTSREFTFYVSSKDRQSEQLVLYIYNNLKDIKNRGFPKPRFVKLTKKQILKEKERLMNAGIRNIPSVVFNGSVYSESEIKTLLNTNINKKRAKAAKEAARREAELQDYYEDEESRYGNTFNRIKENSHERGYQSSDEPMTKDELDNILKDKKFKPYEQRYGKRNVQEEDDDDTVKGNTVSSESEEEEPVKPKKKSKSNKSNKKNKDYDNDISVDEYYANMALEGGEIE